MSRGASKTDSGQFSFIREGCVNADWDVQGEHGGQEEDQARH